MARQAGNKFEVAVLDAPSYLEAVHKVSQNMVVIVDVHDDWCGANMAIQQFYSQLWLEIDAPETRIYLSSVSKEVPEIYEAFKTTCPAVKVAAQGCRPLFLVFRHGQLAEVIDGVNTPQIKTAIMNNLPKLAPKE